MVLALSDPHKLLKDFPQACWRFFMQEQVLNLVPCGCNSSLRDYSSPLNTMIAHIMTTDYLTVDVTSRTCPFEFVFGTTQISETDFPQYSTMFFNSPTYFHRRVRKLEDLLSVASQLNSFPVRVRLS